MTSLSTSSSELPVASRRYYLRLLLIILLGMGVALGLVRAFVAANGASSQSILGRVLEARAAIPAIVSDPKDLVMVFGSSMVQTNFSPREFDQELATRGVDVSSWNFGFGGLNPLFQDYLARRIAEDLEKHDRRLKLALIEFNPFQTTRQRRSGAVALEESYIALLASPKELFQILLKDPERGLRMLEIRYLRDGISAEMITTFFWGTPFETPDQHTDLVEEDGVEERLDEVLADLNERFEAEYPDYDGSDWYFPWKGGGTIKAERPADTLQLFEEYYTLTRTQYQLSQDRLERIQSADIEQLHFDPELVEAFISIIRQFQRIADHVEVVLLPKNTDWIKNPPEALARQAAVVEQLQAATGATVRDFQQIDAVSNDMFADTTHLNRYHGAVAFTHHLVEIYAEALR